MSEAPAVAGGLAFFSNRVGAKANLEMLELFHLSKQVATAITRKLPVVALESTVIAHGLPQPQNFDTALRLEQLVRSHRAVPATVGMLAGELRVGLAEDEVRTLAESHDVKKLSTRDLATGISRKWHGATTVASTIWIAHRAGIRVFATGGIGGVHRGGLPDVSADLPELARTPVIVVCSGAKIVLDLPATREWLETNSVTLIGYGCDELPAFYSRTSGLSVDVRCESPEEVADIFRTQSRLGLQSALLVTVPVPEDFEVGPSLLQRVLDEALREAEAKKIKGRDVTPFLLSRMSERSAGATLRANIALLENNASVAAQIACALCNGSYRAVR